MALEPIRRRAFSELDRAEVQEHVARAIEADPTPFLERYARLEQSFGGRYVSADLFKETFEPYCASKESRNRYNAPVHNAAAVLAAEQFRRVLGEPAGPGQEAVILLTGIPGAGKTSTVLAKGELPRHTHAVYEGQLARPEVALARVKAVLDAGLQPVIVAVHASPERALENTLERFEEIGRGAGIDVMASIQAGLPSGIAAVRDRFAEAVELRIVDRREFVEPKELRGWEHLAVLKSEGDYEQVKQRLTRHLEQQQHARLPEAAWRQAAGLAPVLADRRIDAGLDRQHEGTLPGREATQAPRQEALLSEPLPSAAPTSATERLRKRAEQVAERVTAERAGERAAARERSHDPPEPAKSHERDRGPDLDLGS